MNSGNSTVSSTTSQSSSSSSPITISSTSSSSTSSTTTSSSSSTPVTTSSSPPSSTTSSSSIITTTASSQPPSTIKTTLTSIVSTNSADGSVSTIIVTQSVSPSTTITPGAVVPVASGSAASSAPIALQTNSRDESSSAGLSAGGKTAVAVVVPVVVVALLVLGGIYFWRKRKQRKNAEEARRKEVEEYGFNPNTDPTLPTIGAMPQMSEEDSGYRGWGSTNTNRKASTTLSGGLTQLSDSGSNPGGYPSPGSPTVATVSDGHSADPLVGNRRETMDSEKIGALGNGPPAGANRSDIHRGPSNASSSYSAANRSDTSGEAPIPINGHPQDYYMENAYYQPGPYGDPMYGQQPVIRDVSARRNTRIENPTVFPQQGNAGISQNF